MLAQTTLQQTVSRIKGIGPKKAAKLNKLGIYTVRDLLYSFPRDHEDRRHIKPIASVLKDESVMILAKVSIVRKSKFVRNRKQMLKLWVEDVSGRMEIIFFNASYLLKSFEKGKKYYFYGKISSANGKNQMIHPDFSEAENEEIRAIMPVYPLTEGLSQKERRRIQREAMNHILEIQEYLPETTLKRNRLCDIQYALNEIHFPESEKTLKVAKFRLVFEELLFLQTGLFVIKSRIQDRRKTACFSKEPVNPLIKQLPFKLTNSQYKVVKEIVRDMEGPKVMNRLVQGDVGSGKTVIAAAAVYKSYISDYQSVLMAPTEILARQHFETFKDLFSPFPIRIAFLSKSTPNKEKETLYLELESGKIDLLIGTHAVIQEGTRFKRLGLVITDEQHRFGVNQRAALADKGIQPEVLVMTATPIPRTLALILYGDLDISLITELPPGRKEIKTLSIHEKKRLQAYNLVADEVNRGRQAYIVAPLIEDSENFQAKSVETLNEELKKFFKEYKVSVLHGNLKQAEKDTIMDSFIKGETQILISTVLIEVGINVPNATVMVVESAERFGLAQLHQLRGRVGRGQHQSYCLLIYSGSSSIAKERMDIMEETNNGFLIAEKDLDIRGPGEFFGTKQHGIPELKIANLFKHIKVLKKVQEEANIILDEDPLLQKKENEKLKDAISMLFMETKNFSI